MKKLKNTIKLKSKQFKDFSIKRSKLERSINAMAIIDHSINRKIGQSVAPSGHVETLAKEENLANKFGINIPVYHLSDKGKQYRVS